MIEPKTYSTATIAKLLDLSTRRVQQLVTEGVIPRAERGRYALAPTVQGYIGFLRERAVNADVGAADIGGHRSRKVKEEADQLEMKNAQMRGELLPRDEVHVAVTSTLALVRSKILALANKLAPVMAPEMTLAEAREIIKGECHDALNELGALDIAGVSHDGA